MTTAMRRLEAMTEEVETDIRVVWRSMLRNRKAAQRSMGMAGYYAEQARTDRTLLRVLFDIRRAGREWNA